MKYTAKNLNKIIMGNIHESISRRQSANYERFMQEKADVFQVTGTKEQAMFWVLSPISR